MMLLACFAFMGPIVVEIAKKLNMHRIMVACIVIGGSVIGGNVFITSSISEDTRVSVANQELRFDTGSGGITREEEGRDALWKAPRDV